MQGKIDKSNILVFDNRNFKVHELAQQVLDLKLENELLEYSLSKDQLVSNRAIWVLTHCSDIDFKRIKPFHLKLVSHLKNENLHSGVIRSILRFFKTNLYLKNMKLFY